MHQKDSTKIRYLKFAGWGCLFGALSGLSRAESVSAFIGSVVASAVGFLLFALISDLTSRWRKK